MKYCSNCITASTRPQITINNKNICSACDFFQKKKKLFDFKKIINEIRKKPRAYDCLIPVSGGKDSTWQVHIVKKFGLNPLAITYKTPLRTKIGQQNLDNLVQIGVDHIEYTVNPKIEKKFIKAAFIKKGIAALPMHMAMWAMCYNIASKFDIPYIFWGENSAKEYSGTKRNSKLDLLDNNWIKKFGVNGNTKIKDWYSKELTKKKLTPYLFDFSKKKNIKGIFLGDYFFWDPKKVLKVSKKLGFKYIKNSARTGTYDFADIDDYLISVHHFLKIYKFGFTRAFDNLSLEVRYGRLKRVTAVKKANQDMKKIPKGDIKKFCNYIGISTRFFFRTCEKFRNKNIWSKVNGKWTLINTLK